MLGHQNTVLAGMGERVARKWREPIDRGILRQTQPAAERSQGARRQNGSPNQAMHFTDLREFHKPPPWRGGYEPSKLTASAMQSEL
jgi:hypothetical protein